MRFGAIGLLFKTATIGEIFADYHVKNGVHVFNDKLMFF
jgi:hypothetical protein